MYSFCGADFCSTDGTAPALLQIDPQELYQREGSVPAARLQQALQQEAQSSDAHMLALQAALSGIVWTASMRRMYTLVDR